MELSSRRRPVPPPRSAFVGFRFPPDVIMVAVRLYLRYNLSYRDVEELLLERGAETDHVTIFRWVLPSPKTSSVQGQGVCAARYARVNRLPSTVGLWRRL